MKIVITSFIVQKKILHITLLSILGTNYSW